jgi:16S rRNA (cytidine1402-2'-O)-methyltransferase
MAGTLFICGTPIGNLDDVTIRLLKTLRAVELIACEDTRRTLKLLNRYRIRKPLLSYHEFSKPEREREILRHLERGADVAYVSDAGMPLVSDPGGRLVEQAIQAGYPVVAIPGPSAGLTAWIVSGQAEGSFVFLGFPPEKGSRRREFFSQLAGEKHALILYEAPHRLLKTLTELQTALGGERRACAARELTKIHEEVRRATLAELEDYYAAHPPQGEFCLVIGAPAAAAPPALTPELVTAAVSEARQLMEQGYSRQAALKDRALAYHLPKSLLYKALLDAEEEV